MILRTMTRDEIYRDVEKDVPFVEAKLRHLNTEFGSLVKKSKTFPVIRWTEYLTKQQGHNRWLMLRMATKRSDWDRPYNIIFCVYTTPEGMGVAVPNTAKVVNFFTPHYLYRYKERLHLDGMSEMDVIKKFVMEHTKVFPKIRCRDCNFLSRDSKYKEKYGEYICLIYDEGVAIVDESADPYNVFVTFLSNDMLYRNQKEVVEQTIIRQEGIINAVSDKLRRRREVL